MSDWLTTLGAFAKWLVGWLPSKPAPATPKPPLTAADMGWDAPDGKPIAGPLKPGDKA